MQETTTIASDEAATARYAGVDRRLLIDGQLLDTSRTFPSLNPATGEVLGHAPDATVAHAEAAIAAARRAFDETDWSTNAELRDPLPRAVPSGADRPPRRARRAHHRRGRRHRRRCARARSSTSRSRSSATTPTC